MCIVLLVGRSTIVELVFKRKSFPCLVLHQTDKILKAVIFSSGRLLHPPSTVYLSAFGLPELDLLKSSGQSLFAKAFWVSIHTNELHSF